MITRSLPAAIVLLFAAILIALRPYSGGSATGAPPIDDTPMLLGSPRAVAVMETGRDFLLRFRIRDAERALLALAGEPGGRSAAYYYLSAASLLKLLVSDEDVYYDEFFDRSDSLATSLAGFPDSPWRTFLEAESHLQQSIARAKRGKYLRAALSGGKAFRSYDRLVREDSLFYDAYKGLGLLHFAVGSLPGVYRTFLSVLGMHGSVEDGLEELRLAADSSLYAREESGVLLSLFDIVVDIDGDAGTRLKTMYSTYPDSPLFGHLYGFYLYSERRAEEALAVLSDARSFAERPEYFDLHYIDYYLADTHFRLGRYDEAIPYYQSYLDHQRGPALKAVASLGMGLSLEMVGQRLAATSFYMDVEQAREFDSDMAARRRAEHLVRHPLTGLDRSLLEGRNAFDSGRYTDSIEILSGVLESDTLEPSVRAEALYRVGRSRHVLGELEAALDSYYAAIAADGLGGLRWPPWSAYYAGRIHETAGRREEALGYYEQALRYPGDYDYKQALEKNVKVARERLGRSRRD